MSKIIQRKKPRVLYFTYDKYNEIKDPIYCGPNKWKAQKAAMAATGDICRHHCWKFDIIKNTWKRIRW